MINGTVFFAFVVGALSGLVAAGAVIWAKDLRLKMTWWKWLPALLWYLLLNFSVLLAFTMIGEGETGAGLKMLVFFGVILVILGAGLVRLLLAGRAADKGLPVETG
ncbi:MAG: hypothetical protein KAW12_07890 [Candidatus Aminicenantes bacterium]|nr:hypothetical protein [Candidatus Aminicenantes bacterium]